MERERQKRENDLRMTLMSRDPKAQHMIADQTHQITKLKTELNAKTNLYAKKVEKIDSRANLIAKIQIPNPAERDATNSISVERTNTKLTIPHSISIPFKSSFYFIFIKHLQFLFSSRRDS